MAYPVVRTRAQHNLDCYLMASSVWHIHRLLGHDTRSQHWKSLEPWLRGIYEEKQRATARPRISELGNYVTDRLMAEDKYGALPPISIVQFEPLVPGQLTELASGALLLEEARTEVNRVLIDGLARYTAAIEKRELFKLENPDGLRKLDESFEFGVALYVPRDRPIDKIVAGQMFSDFNSYAWLVPTAKTLAQDSYNPYKQCALAVSAPGGLVARYGGLKSGSSNLGKKDTAFTTEMAMAQFCKVAIEGKKGIGKLNKPVKSPRIASLDPAVEAQKIASFLAAIEHAMGSTRFQDRTQLFRTAHGLYALAHVANEVIYEGRAAESQAAAGIAGIDWTWANNDFRTNIGRKDQNGGWKLNTGTASIRYLIDYCLPRCGIMITAAAA
jgi:hypothetical protein